MYLLLYVFLVLATEVGASSNSTTKIVQTGNGPVRGKLVHSYGGQSGYAFLGIPYARPPVGQLRFKAPQPVEKWTQVLDVTSYRQGCISDKLSNLLDPNVVTSEDCLFANVFTSEYCLETRDCPVLAFIHGGSFKYLTPADFREDVIVNNFANQNRNVVMVSLAFRGDLLGWMNLAPSLNTSADSNISLRDNLAGLKWVQNEIHNFGGDPKRVTLLGHSSGATVVEMLSYLPAFQGLFHQLVSMSGFDFGGDYSQIGNSKYSQTFARRAECASQDENFTNLENVEKVLACLRTIPASRIQDLLNSAKDEAEEVIGPFVDGPTGIFPTYQDELRRTRPPMNLLIGTLAGEKRDIKRLMADNGTSLVPERLLEYCDHLGHELRYEAPEEFAKACFLAYSKENRTEMLDDEKTFYMSSINIANSLLGKGKIFMYSYSYTGGLNSWGKRSAVPGVEPSHAEDFIYIFGLNRVNFTKRDQSIERIYTGMIANFVRDSDPSYGGYTWKEWTTQDMNYFHIDFDEDLVMPGNKKDYHREAFVLWNKTFPSVAGSPRPLEAFPECADSYSMRSVLFHIASDFQKVSQTKKSLLVEEEAYKSWTDFLSLLKHERKLSLARRNVDLYRATDPAEDSLFSGWLLFAGLVVTFGLVFGIILLRTGRKKEYISY